MLLELTNQNLTQYKEYLEENFKSIHGDVSFSDHFLLSTILNEIDMYQYLDRLIIHYSQDLDKYEEKLRQTIITRQKTVSLILTLLKKANLLPVVVKKPIEVEAVDPLDQFVPKEVLELEKKSKINHGKSRK